MRACVYFDCLRVTDLLHTTHVTIQPITAATSSAPKIPETAPSGVMIIIEHLVSVGEGELCSIAIC